jgi:GMP synthase (glutamine-hydrolysing)
MRQDIHQHRILILDFGSQYTQLIARRVREIGVYCEIWPWDARPAEIRQFAPRGIILSGGPESVHSDDGPQAPEIVYELDVPVLGICYGLHTMATQLGGIVEPSSFKEFGYARVTVDQPSRLLQAIEDHIDEAGRPQLDVWMSHGDKVVELPAGFEVVASTDSAPIAAIADDGRGFYGIQFHPEVTHTVQGGRILERFVHEICGCEERWTAENIIKDSVERIQQQVGSDQVMLGLSGGVDSSVVAAMLHQAIGDQLTCIFVDTGMLRYREPEQVMATFARHMGVKVIKVEARERFLQGLAGVTDPEEKRKIIGGLFIDVFEEQAKKLGDAKWLAQGTIYPDVIESAASKTGKAEVIKSHHNVGGLPDKMKLKVVEPLRLLFKDEVRRVGKSMGIDAELLGRHPFPGPGLGIRILGDITAEKVRMLQEVDHIFVQGLKDDGLYDKVWQAGAMLLPVNSVGVMGDERTYEKAVVLRAVESTDGMTADWVNLPYEFLQKTSNKIINGVKGVNRVVYDISSKPPATIEWE